MLPRHGTSRARFPAGLFLCMRERFDAVGTCALFPWRELRVPAASGRTEK